MVQATEAYIAKFKAEKAVLGLEPVSEGVEAAAREKLQKILSDRGTVEVEKDADIAASDFLQSLGETTQEQKCVELPIWCSEFLIYVNICDVFIFDTCRVEIDVPKRTHRHKSLGKKLREKEELRAKELRAALRLLENHER